MDLGLPIPVITIIAILFLLIFFYFVPIGLWFTALLSGVRITLLDLLFMRFRKSPVKEVVNGLIMSHKAGILLEREELEAHGLAGGDINNVVTGMIKARKSGFELSFEKASAADFEGIKIIDAIQYAIDKQNKEENIFK